MASSTNKFAHGLPPDATSEELQEYAEYCLENYKDKKWTNDTLLEYYLDDFQQFSLNDFKGLEKNTRRLLPDHLRANGVYVPKGLGIEISAGLLTTCNEHPPWPEGEPGAPAPTGRPLLAPDEPPEEPVSSSAAQPHMLNLHLRSLPRPLPQPPPADNAG